MKKLIFCLFLSVGCLSYCANLEQKNTAYANFNNMTLIPPSFFSFLLYENKEDNTYVHFNDYYDHASDLLIKYIKVNPDVCQDLDSRKFIRSALIAVLISVKYAEEKTVYISDLLYMFNKQYRDLFSLEEMKIAEINFLSAIKWKTAHPKEYLVFSDST